MSIIDQKAAEAASLMTRDNSDIPHVVALDPLTLLAIGGFLINVIELFMSCRKSEDDGLYRMQNPGMMDRWAMRRLIKKRIKSMPKVYGASGSQLDLRMDMERAIREMAAGLTVNDVKQMYKEAALKPQQTSLDDCE